MLIHNGIRNNKQNLLEKNALYKLEPWMAVSSHKRSAKEVLFTSFCLSSQAQTQAYATEQIHLERFGSGWSIISD